MEIWRKERVRVRVYLLRGVVKPRQCGRPASIVIAIFTLPRVGKRHNHAAPSCYRELVYEHVRTRREDREMERGKELGRNVPVRFVMGSPHSAAGWLLVAEQHSKMTRNRNLAMFKSNLSDAFILHTCSSCHVDTFSAIFPLYFLHLTQFLH